MRFVNGHNSRKRAYTVEDRGYETPCHIWAGMTDAHGYGYLKTGNRRPKAHRYLYEQRHGLLDPAIHVHHKCNQRACIRDEHLEAMDGAAHSRLTNRLVQERVTAALELLARVESGEWEVVRVRSE